MDTPDPQASRLTAQFAFLTEADRLKSVLRASPLADASRRENSAEHSWHLALYAMALADQAGPEVDINRVLRMLILHDLVEIDVGDVPLHSQDGQAHGSAEIQEAEAKAAARIFGLLPPDIGAPFLALWQEFEAAETPDAVFAKSLDRTQPVLQNLASGGGSWTEYGVTLPQIETRVGVKIARGAPAIWTHLHARLRQVFARG
ncbi:HD domain-containing protein [Solirhodobacter olei]|uniref:HD domain-containing protein n=1 Tax=Solirhodobacter olei TaxID=2493082 RepID=UPI000FDC7E56|nr:HD domain-containing protein [Solirhodobacter olei]